MEGEQLTPGQHEQSEEFVVDEAAAEAVGPAAEPGGVLADWQANKRNHHEPMDAVTYQQPNPGERYGGGFISGL